MADAPLAPRKAHVRTVHGESTEDPYYWLLDRDDPDTIAYLEAENAYTAAQTEHLAPLRERLFEEIKARVQETDLSVPTRRGPWWYVTRTEEGKQYSIFCRRPGPDDEANEEVLLDGNELAGDSPFFALGIIDVSPDHSVLAYSTDFDGNESYTLRFKNLATGETLADAIEATYYSSAWGLDNATFFYTTIDDAHRPYRLWRHRLGTPASADELVYEETDERFFLGVELTRSERFVVVDLASKVTTEVRILDAAHPDGELQVFASRRQGVEYSIDHQGDRFLVLHNDGALNFELAHTPVTATDREHWTPLLPHRDDTRLIGMDAFADHVVVHLRRDALTRLRVLRNDGDTHDIEFDEPIFDVAPGANAEYDTTLFRLNYESFVTPPTVYDYDLDSHTLELKKQQPVLGGYDHADYIQTREWATASDGTRVPISVVRRREVALDGQAPCLLYGYGSYETSLDPWFSAIRLPMLDRGIVFAVAHVRGGGEVGRQWYEDGKLLHKRNTFTDFVAAAEHLCAQRYTSPARMAARGASAGGLLMGAVANLAPQQFAAIVAEVPFVDALNTILDPTLPLTVIEWEEWGNPVESAEVYSYMKSYSPYENIEATAYPAILATAGLNDPRVGYHEPAKWVAKLRTTKTDDRPLLLKTEMGAGHGGPSGRYDLWRDQAFVMAFVIQELGAPDLLPA